MADALRWGRRFRTINLIDDFNSEAPRIEIDTDLPARRIVPGLDELIEIRGRPADVRMDNGLEPISNDLEKWARRHSIDSRFIQPGKPMQNGLIKRFNRTYGEEVLDCYFFETLGEVRRMTADCINRYNQIWTHDSRGDVAPRQCLLAKFRQPPTSKWSIKRGGYRTIPTSPQPPPRIRWNLNPERRRDQVID